MKIYFQVFQFIRQYQPYSVFSLLVLFILTSLLEALGISLIMPFIALVLEENFLKILQDSNFGILVPSFIFEMKREEALLFFSISLISMYFIKNIILVISEYFKMLFINQTKANLSNALIKNYLHQDYIFHSTKSTSEINGFINQKLIDLTDGLIGSVLTIFAEIILVFGLFLLIIFFNQLDTFLILLALFSFGIISGKIINIFVKKLGIKRQKQVNEKFLNFNTITNNFREILLTGKIRIYFDSFKNSLKLIARWDAIRSSLQKTPHLVFETVGVIGLISIIYYLLNSNVSSIKIITVCTFFAAISYRAIPSLNKIFYFHYNIKYYKPIFSEVIGELKIVDKIQYHSDKFEDINSITAKNVSFKYSDQKNLILKEVNLEIKLNSTIGIYGKSGSGKTSLLDILSCLVNPNSGFIYVNNEKIENRYLRRKLQNNISYTSQKTSVINDTLLKNICFGIEEDKIDYEKYDKILQLVELKELESSFKKNLNKMSDLGSNISGGQLQRIGIARALYRDKEIVIFDEATNALDEELESRIISRLNKLKNNKAIIFVSHNIDLFENFDNIYKVEATNILKIK